MASVSWGSHKTGHSADEMRSIEQNILSQLGFSDVQVLDGGSVFGIRSDVHLMIGHLSADGGNLHEVVVAAGDTSDAANGTREEVVDRLRNVVFFDDSQ